MTRYRTVDTRAIHSGALDPRPGGAVVTPIFQSANYLMAQEDAYDAVRYLRLSNSPNHHVLAARLAALEGAEEALVTASGMAAIAGALLTFLSSGDHVIVAANLYGGTATFVEHDLPRWGVSHTAIDPTRPDTWAAALRPTTRAIYVEGVSNPLLTVAAHPEVTRFAREHGLLALIDNTFPSPVNFRPVEHGYDLVLHSATKYLNGHSDIVAGVVAGKKALVDRVRKQMNHLGGSLDAHAAFLLERGLKTLAVRVRRQNESAGHVARFLAAHPAVRAVRYPGLPDDPGHAVAKRLFDGFGGMLSFEARDAATALRFVDGVNIAVHAASLGSVESLVVRPSRSSHLGMSAEARAALGITDALVRVSVGLEDPDELCEDFARALGA